MPPAIRMTAIQREGDSRGVWKLRLTPGGGTSYGQLFSLMWSEFKGRLFKPLEHVVYHSYDIRIRDNVYQARHPVIAEIVFDRLLQDPDERFEEYHRCVTALNIDYSTDEKAFRQLIRGRNLLELFPNPDHCQAIFEAASSMVGDEPHLLQQKAIYEMHRSDRPPFT